MLRIEPSPSQICTARVLPLSPITVSRVPPGLISQPLSSKVEMVASPAEHRLPLYLRKVIPRPILMEPNNQETATRCLPCSVSGPQNPMRRCSLPPWKKTGSSHALPFLQLMEACAPRCEASCPSHGEGILAPRVKGESDKL